MPSAPLLLLIAEERSIDDTRAQCRNLSVGRCREDKPVRMLGDKATYHLRLKARHNRPTPFRTFAHFCVQEMMWIERDEYFGTWVSPATFEVIPAIAVVVQPDYRIVARKPSQAVWGDQNRPFVVV